MEKMENFLNSVKSIKNKSKYKADPEFSFAVTWGYNLIDVIKLNRSDEQFVGELVMTAADYFRNNLTDQQKVDVFCLLLGNVTGKSGGK